MARHIERRRGVAVNVAEQHRDSGCRKGVECRLGSRQIGRQDGGFRVEERKGQFFTGSPAVDWNHDRADLDGRGEGDEPVSAVARRSLNTSNSASPCSRSD